uniref:BPTI/Kunitz inhibitor domain-containing protein n=1 Tax=Chelonoidis abingdonii TaxID=106734 RepID=A0A8C0GES3_CHEAB
FCRQVLFLRIFCMLTYAPSLPWKTAYAFCQPICLPDFSENQICKLPAEPGPCFTYMSSYFYNSVTKRCEEFVYGGCQGNGNRFPSMDKCLQTSPIPTALLHLASPTPPATRLGPLPVQPGPCKAYTTLYFYNSATKKCEEFRYGGCQGNENRFATKDECFQTCGRPGTVMMETQLGCDLPRPELGFQFPECSACQSRHLI